MIANFNGHRAYWKGNRPKKPVLWQGTIYVKGPAAQAIQVPWQSIQTMTYDQAQEAIIAARLLGEKAFQDAYEIDPEAVTFQLRCR